MFNVTEPLTAILLLTATVLLIFLGKEIKKPYVIAIALIAYLAMLIVHSVQANMPAFEQTITTLRYCIAFDLVMILVTFFAYLWIDDISCKFYNKKSIDNSLDWFWSKV